MSDAQKQILQMLADKVISVDEAERLLRALQEGETRKEEPKSRAGTAAPGIGSIFESVGETVAEIGSMVKNTMEDVITGLLGDELGDLNEEELEEAEAVEGQYKIKEGTRMLIVNSWRYGPSKGDIIIRSIEGEFCKIENESSNNIKTQQNASNFVIQWMGGSLTVEVPETVTILQVRIKGGNIRVERLGCKMNVETLAGDLDLSDLVANFKAKTMGGNVNLVLSKEWQGKALAHTMGGNIDLAIPADVSLSVESFTMGGTIKVDKDIHQLESKQLFLGKSSVNVQIGEETSDSGIVLKTMGGDIELRKV